VQKKHQQKMQRQQKKQHQRQKLLKAAKHLQNKFRVLEKYS
jgi:hypothetical protein